MRGFHSLKPLMIAGNILAMLVACPVLSRAEVDEDLQNWYLVTATADLGHRMLGYFEVQPRIGNDIFGPVPESKGGTHFSQILIRPSLGYKLNEHVSLWQGYAWAPSYIPRHVNENRIFQQVLINNRIKRVQLVNRTRLEQRFLENVDDTSVRVRHLLRLAVPIGKSKWSWVASDELFVNLNNVKNGPGGGFDQNRAFVGINRKFNDTVNMDLGYMNQYVNRDDPFVDRMNHIIMVGMYFNVR